MNASKHTCCWVLANGQHCGKRVTSYRVLRDDDGNKYRQYDDCCTEHKVKHLQQQLQRMNSDESDGDE